jgi:hypothetical protein
MLSANIQSINFLYEKVSFFPEIGYSRMDTRKKTEQKITLNHKSIADDLSPQNVGKCAIARVVIRRLNFFSFF